jgi:cytochrome c biogenesis protein ResB
VVRSVSRPIFRAGLFAICGLLLVWALSGCTTTQETAALKQAQSKRILERREQKRHHRKTDRKRSYKK